VQQLVVAPLKGLPRRSLAAVDASGARRWIRLIASAVDEVRSSGMSRQGIVQQISLERATVA
jgi:hypothetical protein